ncbi:MAG TPA: hypothetical protein VE398_05360 [Acidobacteriota bacterium]|nr:hypothetical protein [Acidobacteriota bacterium]
MQGQISVIEEDAVTTADPEAGRAITVKRQDARDVKGRGYSQAAKLGIAVGIGVAIVAAIIGYKASHPLDGIDLGEL